MKKEKFSLIEKKIDPAIINGRMSAFGRVPYSLWIRCSKPVDENKYGVVKVNGIPISKGITFENSSVIPIHGLMVPVGEVAREFSKEYRLSLSGFVAVDGTPFADAEFTFKTAEKRQQDKAYAKHDEIALQAAREGMVLLKNDNHVLPLKSDAVLNCFGAGAYMYRVSASGAGMINPRWQPDFIDAVKHHSKFSLNQEVLELYKYLQNVAPEDTILERAKEKEDTAFIFITRDSGEFLDNKPAEGWYYLTKEERKMVEKVTKAFSHTILILNTGYPIELGFIDEYGIDAVIYTGFAGMLSSYALVEILDGRTNPSGKLPDTFALDYYDYPSAKNFINFKAEDKLPAETDYGVRLYYQEDIYVGYRYFETFKKPVTYGFGHGLSYTDFEITKEDFRVEKSKLYLSVNVKNIGTVAGKEVVQVYMKAPEGRLEKPAKVLVAFDKTKLLDADETYELILQWFMDDFASYDESISSYILEKGTYEIYLGDSLQTAILVDTFELEEEQVIKQVKPVAKPVEEFPKLTQDNPEIDGLSKLVPLKECIKIPAERVEYVPESLKRSTNRRITYDMLKEDETLLDDFVAQMSLKELCKMNVCGGANWYMPWQNGAAGKTNVIRKYGLPMMTVSDGNNGLNINKPNIGFPSSATVCASFNKELAYQVGYTIGTESKEHNIQLNLGPAMNIHRNILNGRHPEYFSEDPLLGGIMGGYHGKGLETAGVGSCYKHLFCNGSDTSRKGSHSIVSERALREIYFKIFDIAIRVNMPSALMTSYNALNGIYPAESAELIQGLMREEWGFDGYIMTDWGTYDTVDAVEMVKAGNCWITEGSKAYEKMLYEAAKKGDISRAVLEQNVKYLVKTMRKFM